MTIVVRIRSIVYAIVADNVYLAIVAVRIINSHRGRVRGGVKAIVANNCFGDRRGLF